MKRHGFLYDKVISVENLVLADKKAQKGKKRQRDVIKHNSRRGCNILLLYNILAEDKFVNSEYRIFITHDPKERTIHRLPYYPDRIVHHAIMNILRPIFVNSFVKGTYNCIPGRGIHKASYDLRKYLTDKCNTTFCLKFDIRKFYENIDNEILKGLLRRKIKDNRLLNLLYVIIDSSIGVPLGNYLSQYFGNFYLSYFDHFLKEKLHIKYVLRYCDDIVILGKTKQMLWEWFYLIKRYLKNNLRLSIKSNYQIFPVYKRGIDFVGYIHYHYYTLLRKSIKINFIRMIRINNNKRSRDAYLGWLLHCNGFNLQTKYLTPQHI